MRPDARSVTGIVLGVIGSAVLPHLGRPTALLILLTLLGAVLLPARSATGSWGRAAIAVAIGAGPGLVLLAAVLDLSRVLLPASVTALLLQLAWTGASLTAGRSIAARIDRGALADVAGRFVAVGAVTAFIAGALTRLLGSGYDTVARLAWILGEEDNAQIVGIAREVLTDGPRGAELAEQFGTAFVTLPVALIQMLGGPLAAEPDVRLQAVTVFTVSSIVAIILAGLAMAVLAAIPHHIHGSRAGVRPVTAVRVGLGAVAAGAAALAGFSLLVVLPMRTGFLTFVWGLTIVISAAALAASIPSDATRATRTVLVMHILASGLLLLSSWPFIGPALAPLLLVPMLWARGNALLDHARRRPLAAGLVVVSVLGLMSILTTWFLGWGPAAEVVSYGIGILTIGASGIYADEVVPRVAVLATVALTLAIALGSRGRARSVRLVALIGPTLGAGLLYLGLRTTAVALTGGELGYAGTKLLYGVITLAIILGLVPLTGLVSRLHLAPSIGVALLVLGILPTSPTASLYEEWWGRTLQVGAVHAEAAVEAIRSTNADLPIRCLPSPGTAVTETTRWAAYFCARWMEDAFNEGRFDGRRFALLDASGPTFEATIDQITSEYASEYLFAHRMPMGLGWFGWDGRAD